MVFRVMEALRAIPCDCLGARLSSGCRSRFRPSGEPSGFRLVVGSKEDVLARYCVAIRALGADRVIRATGDNPFVFPDAAAAIAGEGEALGADYAAYSGLPYGAGVEAVAAEALLRAEREASLRKSGNMSAPTSTTTGIFSPYIDPSRR